MQKLERYLPEFVRGRIEKKRAEREFLEDRTFQLITRQPSQQNREEFQRMRSSGFVYRDEGSGEIRMRDVKLKYERGVINLGTGHIDGSNPGKCGGLLLWQMRELAGWKDPSGAKTQGPELDRLPEHVRDQLDGVLLANVDWRGRAYSGPKNNLDQYIAIIPQAPSEEARRLFNTLFLGNKERRMWLERISRAVSWVDGDVDRKLYLVTGQRILVAPGSMEGQHADFIYLMREWAGEEDPTGVAELLKYLKSEPIFSYHREPTEDRDSSPEKPINPQRRVARKHRRHQQ